MSEAPDLSETETLAAEHALGVLSAKDRAAAEQRVASEPAFAALVDEWRQRLAPMLAAVPATAAPAALWARIERLLPANDNAAFRKRLAFWRSAAVGGFGLAAASLAVAVMLANQPPVFVHMPAQPSQPLLNASLMSQGGSNVQPLFVAAYDPDREALIITSLVPAGTDPAHVHQLWVIPADGKPRSLGMVEPGKSKAMPMPKTMLPMLEAGSALAISVEPPGGSPKDVPTGPIAAVGKLAQI